MNRTYKSILKGFIIFGILAGVIYLLRLSGMHEVFDKVWVDEHIRGKGLVGYALFLGLAGMFTAVGFPRQIIGFFAGYAFGALTGTVIGTVGTVLGCVLTFYYARLSGKQAVENKFGRRISKINNFLQREPFQMTVVIRLLPVGSNVLTNLIAGVSAIKASSFIGGSALGYIPQTFIFALLGSGITVDPILRTGASAVLFVVSSIVGYRLYRNYRLESTLNGE